MVNSKLWTALMASLILVLALSACTGNLERNDDGSLTLTAVMTEAELQEELDQALDFRGSNGTMETDVLDGYILVSAEREREQGGGIDTLTFRLDLGVVDGHLSATASEVLFNGATADPDRVAQWNQNMAERLAEAGGQRPNSTLQSVVVGNDTVTMTWRIATRRSQGN